LVFASTGRFLGAPRSNTKEDFSDWSITYELPNTQDNFGLSGEGFAEISLIKKWPYKVFFNDGSAVGYGQLNVNLASIPYDKNNPNGVGEGSYADIYIPQQGRGCHYLVFTGFGRDHLESLISQLRWLKTN
jgi:hypothetical protein